MDFSRRSNTKELLDRDDILFEDIRQNMDELEFINTWLGGHKITGKGVKNLIRNYDEPVKELVIAEIGCGGGDNLIAVEKWCRQNNLQTRLVGIDINGNCIEVARKKLRDYRHTLIHSDYQLVDLSANKPHIIFSSLFCHHFTDDQLVEMMKWMQRSSTYGFFINDLHRHPLAYYSIKLLTTVFSRSYLVKNDAPLSVRRGFTSDEWDTILKQAGIENYSIEWKWAFRYLITAQAHQ